jgi:hypothetical protein
VYKVFELSFAEDVLLHLVESSTGISAPREDGVAKVAGPSRGAALSVLDSAKLCQVRRL